MLIQRHLLLPAGSAFLKAHLTTRLPGSLRQPGLTTSPLAQTMRMLPCPSSRGTAWKRPARLVAAWRTTMRQTTCL